MFSELHMKHKLYRLYQMDWMMSHGYTFIDLMDAMDDYFQDEDNEVEVLGFQTSEDWFDEWLENGNGFGGELWAGFGEFCDCELSDRDYISNLIGNIGDCGLRRELAEAYDKYLKERG